MKNKNKTKTMITYKEPQCGAGQLTEELILVYGDYYIVAHPILVRPSYESTKPEVIHKTRIISISSTI